MARFIIYLNLFLLIYASIQAPAYAYIDPGTGTIILQALIGGIVAGGAAVSLYWRKLKSFFSKKKKDEKNIKN